VRVDLKGKTAVKMGKKMENLLKTVSKRLQNENKV